MLQSEVQTSEALLQDLKKSFSQSQNAVQSRLVSDVSVPQRVSDEKKYMEKTHFSCFSLLNPSLQIKQFYFMISGQSQASWVSQLQSLFYANLSSFLLLLHIYIHISEVYFFFMTFGG